MSIVGSPVHAAMILAAGRGERMRPLTDHKPKPLLEIGGRPLIFRHLDKLAAAGFGKVVVNHAHLGAMIEQAVGDGSRWGVRVLYSPEALALETAGGIRQALPLIDSTAFAVLNADVFSDYDYALLAGAVARLQGGAMQAHLVLVDNPDHNERGDFSLAGDQVGNAGREMLTFSGMGAYRAELFEPLARGTRHALAPLLREQIARGRVSGEHFRGWWTDVGTPERLAQLDEQLRRETRQ